ncbi:rhomboid family intramembrane serine protease [Nocardioides bruguierae]|uniref:Rhomboid family intramembrane serine protease n=1 Tax=Nocardioides bruguierae TaxID=2945102 RepID=A0A9X2D477_9ACTN|nr:rhomboid family intramembrane serine protease [Nocardioides bruguierae]MCM0619031.1 rhomboid family intramembrane serine protease [Nocardioides bruguierae]
MSNGWRWDGRSTWGPQWRTAGVLTLGFTALLWVLETIDQATPLYLDDDGVVPRTVSGLDGILWAPMLHAGFAHLMGNTMLLAPLMLLTLVGGVARGLAATGIIWVVAGVGTWLIAAPGTVHLGASSLVFGWLTYLIARGFYARSIAQVVLGVVLAVLLGGTLLGVLPGQPGISWQGHLFGAIGGVIAASALRGRPRALPAADYSY